MSRRIEDVLFEHTGERKPSAKTARKAAEEIRGRATRFGEAAVSDQLRVDAKRLDEYASGLDLSDVERDLGIGDTNTAKSPVQRTADQPKPKRRNSRSDTKTKRPAKKPSRARGIAARVVSETAQQTRARSASEWLWDAVGVAVALALVYLVLSRAEPAVRLIDMSRVAMNRFIYPPGVIPDPSKLQGPPAPTRYDPRQTRAARTPTRIAA